MRVLVGLLAILGAVVFWRMLAGAARGSSDERRREDHSVDAVEDPRLAATGIAVAIATMDKPISQAEIQALVSSVRETFDVTEREALDIVSFGRGIAGQCATNAEAVQRLSKIVAERAGPDAEPDLVRMITEVATADKAGMSDEEMNAVETVRRALGTE